MPSNTGLYGDSDDESLSEELSPTDGYFNGRNHPQDVLIPDPSQALSDSNSDKAQEARQEGEASRASEAGAASRRQSQHSPPSTPSSRRRIDPVFEDEAVTEATPLLPSAPPTYSAATSDRPFARSGSRSSASENSRPAPHSNMGRPEIFLPSSNQPQDLGGDPLLAENWRREEGWKRQLWNRITNNTYSIAKFLIILVSLIIGIGFILDTFLLDRNHHDSTKTPIIPQPGFDPAPGHWPSSCPAGHTGGASFGLADPSEFTFLQLVSSSNTIRGASWTQVQTSGEIHIRPATYDLDSAIRIDVNLRYSDSALIKDTSIKFDNDKTTLSTPSHITSSSSGSSWSRPCMDLVVTIWVSPRTHLNSFTIQTQTLSVTFHPGLSFHTTTLSIQAGSNTIIFPSTPSLLGSSLSSREIILTTTSGSIHGTYPLYDLLRITTSSGSIAISLTPQNVSTTSPKPATLDVHTNSGSIHINTPILSPSFGSHTLTAAIPPRDYRTTIVGGSGSLDLALIHGSRTSLSSNSGSIYASLSPYTLDQSDISTDTSSGTTRLTVLSPPEHLGERMTKLFANHKYVSGSLNLAYPAEWEGTLEGETSSGSINVNWPGMQVVQGSRSVKGVVGDGEGVINFVGKSGSANIRGGGGRAVVGDDGEGTGEEKGDGEGKGKDEDGGPGFGAPPRWPGYDDEWGMGE